MLLESCVGHQHSITMLEGGHLIADYLDRVRRDGPDGLAQLFKSSALIFWHAR